MTEIGDRLVRHELLEKPVPEPFNEGCGSKASEDIIRYGDSGVSRHDKGQAVTHRNFETASGGFSNNKVPFHILLFNN